MQSRVGNPPCNQTRIHRIPSHGREELVRREGVLGRDEGGDQRITHVAQQVSLVPGGS